jgi:hypothetical protein
MSWPTKSSPTFSGRSPPTSRRRLLGAVAASALFGPIAAIRCSLAADPIPATAAVARGRRFLEALFDPAFDLLPEYRGSDVYWLFHDNYLAAKVLGGSNPALAGKIGAAIRRFGGDRSGKIEILFGEARRPLPFRHYELTEVRRVGDKIVKTEVVKDEPLHGWEEYADLLFLAAIAEADHDTARRHFDDGLELWDGTGFRDRAATTLRLYSTYKLALSLIAAARLGVKPQSQPLIVRRLLDLQGEDGGWVTDSDERRRPVGVANVETTCLAILGLESVAGRS